MEITLILILSYLIGSIPSAYLVGRIFANVDIRTVGSGNVGATNVYRVVGKAAGIGVLIIDILKGFLPVYVVGLLGFDTIDKIVAGLGAVSGHIWTIFLKFKGGKGVATALGIFLGIAPIPILISLVLAIPIVVISKYASLGSITGALFFSLLLVFFEKEMVIKVFCIAVSVLVVIRHLPNMKRLITGQEHKFGTKLVK